MQSAYPDNPRLVRYWRGDAVESVHRGAWVLVDCAGEVLDSAGDIEFPVYARSSTKGLQALPLIESGAADALDFSTEELALAVASHRGEECHTRVVKGLLDRLELGPEHLQCGSHWPGDAPTRRALAARGEEPSTLHNNCSGKHAAFLALGKHLGEDPAGYIDPESELQQLVRQAVLEMTSTDADKFSVAVDGCSAPTFRLPLRNLALGFARFANPEGLSPGRRAACERLAQAVEAHPHLIGGTHKHICSAISSATAGRLYPKVGAEAVYVIGERGGGRALALKMDDGQDRGLRTLVLHLLRRFDLAKEPELDALAAWAAGPISNYAGRVVGRTEVVE